MELTRHSQISDRGSLVLATNRYNLLNLEEDEDVGMKGLFPRVQVVTAEGIHLPLSTHGM